jgi:hypothetical protein
MIAAVVALAATSIRKDLSCHVLELLNRL